MVEAKEGILLKDVICKDPNIRIIWNDKIENYSAERVKEIKAHYCKKYNTQSVNIIFKATNQPKYISVGDGDVESLTNNETQEKLFKVWLEENNVDLKLPDILKLNKRVESLIENKSDVRFTKWAIKKITLDNFLSYGEVTEIDYSKLKGLTLFSGNNQMGKTSAILESLLFLLFNETTKTKTADEVINIYTGKDYCKVSGEILIDGVTYFIERSVIRKWKKDKTSYTTATNLDVYKILSDGTKEIQNGEKRQETDKILRESIGTMKDFLMTIVCTGDNISDILEAQATERGKVISRFLGLDIFETKEKLAKDLHSDWKTKSKLNVYNITDLETQISEHEEKITTAGENLKTLNENLETVRNDIQNTTKIKDAFLSALNLEVERKMANINPKALEKVITDLTRDKGVKVGQIKELEAKLSLMPTIDEYDIKLHDTKTKELTKLNTDLSILESEGRKFAKLIEELKKGEFCPTCKQSMKDVDHTEEISKYDEEMKNKKAEYVILRDAIKEKEPIVEEMDTIKAKISEVETLKLKKDKLDIEIESIDLKIGNQQEDLDEYKSNLNIIEENKKIEGKIRDEEIKLKGLNTTENEIERDIQKFETEITINSGEITKKKDLIVTLKKEDYFNKIFNTYIQMVGKNGITKTIIRNSVPAINSELQRLLTDVCDFTVGIDVDIKNNVVDIWMEDNDSNTKKPFLSGSGFEKTIGSLALRTVLTKVNTLPKTNILILDEVLGKVSKENYTSIKNFIDKLKTMFDTVFLITHESELKEWADKTIYVSKVNHSSSLTFG